MLTVRRKKFPSMMNVLLMLGAFFWFCTAQAQTVCAEVKIEIQQKLNIERQGFIATMRIINGLETTSLTNIGVNVKFADRNGVAVRATSNPDDTSALFFIREDFLSGITGGVQGGGSISPKSTGEARWLIIPAAGTGGSTPAGEIYAVGATLTYQEGTEVRTVEVTPEVITVRPQPRLELDYFLPNEVYGDDPLTEAIEPSEPFSLGVRIRNVGAGPAQKVSIESAQPKIVENQQGLLIGFQIDGSYVQDAVTQNSLLIDFGNIEPSRSKVGRWVMSTTLSGRFSEFAAEFTHDDALGGAVTSLLERVTTHALLKDVRLDLAGRDAIRDFLAVDGDTIRVYESEGIDSLVANQSAGASVVSAPAGALDLVFNPVSTAAFVKIADPTSGQFEIGRVERSDGKVMLAENVWKSRERTASGTSWRHYLNVFDVGGTGRYRLNAATPLMPSSLGGLVYLDADQDGERDATEQGLSAVVVTLEGLTAAGDEIHEYAASDAAGGFEFGDLAPGEYALIVGLLEGTSNGSHAIGSAGGQVGEDRVQNIVIASGATHTGYKFAKHSSVDEPDQADLGVEAGFASAEVDVGTTTRATIALVNNGPDATDASLTWQLPPGVTIVAATASAGVVDATQARWTLVGLAAGARAELHLDVHSDIAGSIVLHSAVTGTAIDQMPGNNSASATVAFIGPQVDQPAVTQELNRLPRVLAMVVCTTATGVDAACTNARATRLSALLANLGVEHTVVTNTLAYREALRSGRYNIHWISGGANLLVDQLAEELRSALRRGDGVLIEGQHDAKSTLLDNAMGVRYLGATSGPVGMLTTIDGVFDAGTALSPIGATYAIDPVAGTTVESRFASGDEAVLSASVGRGRSLVFAFELTDSAAQSQPTATWNSFVEAALVWLTREPGAAVVGRDYVPLVTRIENPLDTTISVDVSMQLDAGVTLATSGTTLSNGASSAAPRWSISVPAGESRWLEIGLRVPTQSGSPGVRTSVTWRKTDVDILLFDERRTLQVISATQRFESVLTELRALSLADPQQISQRDAAVAALERARALLNDAKPALAAADLVAAEQTLLNLSAAQPTVPVAEVSNLLNEAALRWQTLNPLCGSAEFAGVNVNASTFWPFSANERLEIQGGRAGNADWEWAVGTNTNSPQSRADYAAFSWISGRQYTWQLGYAVNGSATLSVRDGATTVFSKVFTPKQAPGMRSGTAVRIAATLNNSAPDTPTLVTLDRINGAPATAVLQAGVTPQRDGSTAVYFPTMAAGMALEGTIRLTFAGSSPPDRSKLSVQIHAGEIACRPELSL